MSVRPPRLFVDISLAAGEGVPLSAGQVHHLRTVLRVPTGANIALFNGVDGEWLATTADVDSRRITAMVERRLRPQAFAAPVDLWLAFAPLKNHPTNMIVEKATELGATRLWPVVTRFTNSARVNVTRLRANAIKAAEQCERLSIPQIEDPSPLEKALARWDPTRILFVLDETGGGMPVTDVLSISGSGPAGFLVGPEGGFAQSEVDLLQRCPFIMRVNLGPRVLRAETAAIAALSCWQAMCGDWRSRPTFRTLI